MPFLKNNSLRIIHVGDAMILPGEVSPELPDAVMEYSGVKVLMRSKELAEDDGPQESQPPRASSSQPQPKAQHPPQPPKG